MSQSDPPVSEATSSPVDALIAGPGGEGTKARGASAPFAVSQDPLLPGTAADEPPMGTYSPVPAYEHLGDLPPSYGSQSVYLVAYDPRQLFAYWDVDPANAVGGAYGLRVCRADGEVESEVTINPREAGRYLTAGLPGGTYYVELGTSGRAGRWRPVAFSGRVTMPPAGLAGESDPKFATLPFHLSFQRLLELIHDAMGQGEDLTTALSRLQAGDQDGIESLVGTLNSLSREQLQTLERLLGHQVNAHSEAASSFGFGSESVSSFGWSASNSEILSGLGINSAVWSMASGGFHSEMLASDRSSLFFRGLEGNLADLTSMFSSAFATLNSDFLNSESSSSGNGSSSY